MTTNKNFKLKKISNQYTRFFDLKKLLPRMKKNSIEDFGRETVFAQCQRKPISKPRKIVKNPIQWVHTDNVVATHNGSPYMLMSKDHSEDEQKAGPKDPICYNVLREPPAPSPLETLNIVPLVKGIRISICVEHTRFHLIGKVSKNMGLNHVPEHRLWNIQWCDNTPHLDLLKSMKRFQQINHFPGMSEICRKDMLALNLNRMLKMYPGDYRIFPKTWLMPSDAYDVAIYANKHKRTYILKPYSSGQGRGIWLTNNLRNVGRHEKLICQTYIDRPLLIDGFKFDLRVYTLVTSVDPLRIFVYNEGLARFATHKYMPPALGNSNNVFMHLTNYCVNRRNLNYNAGRGDEGGSKRKLCEYNQWLKDHNYNVTEFWAAVDDAIIKTLISAWPVLKHNYHVCFPKHDKIQACFQLLGFDILVDWKLKPFILEVNHTPSLSGDETVDNEVKRPLIRDTLNLISSPLVDKEEIIREDRMALRERLMRQQGKRRAQTPVETGTQAESPGIGELKQPCSIAALAQQIAWEESHLGNYRRIMPPTESDKVNYYCKFYDQIKQISMFKETHTSKTRMKANLEHIKQLKLQEQLNIEQQRQKRDLQERKLKLQQPVDQDTKQKIQEMQRKRQEARNKQNIPCQQQKLLIPTKETVKEESKQGYSKLVPRTRSKCSLNAVKKKLRQQRQSKTRRVRRLAWESQLDAEFVQKHGTTRPAGALNNTETSKMQTTQIPKSNPQDNDYYAKKPKASLKIKKSTTKEVAIKNDFSSLRKCTAKNKSNKYATIKKCSQMLNNWLPETISDEEKQWQLDWRKERSDTLDQWQLKELLFTEMYARGHLTKNDIKLFPFLLYRILRLKSPKEITVNA